MAGVETLRFVSDLDGLQFADREGGRTETTVEVCRDGKWKHGRYGEHGEEYARGSALAATD